MNLGTRFPDHELTRAVGTYVLDPYQYSITKFEWSSGHQQPEKDGLVYRGVNFEKLLPEYDLDRRSAKDYRAQDYHRFLSNDGFFKPDENEYSNTLWYNGANRLAQQNGYAGAGLNVQEERHIIFPEASRGGVDTKNLAKYSWSNVQPNQSGSWEYSNSPAMGVNNESNCEFFSWNKNTYSDDYSKIYSFDSNYLRNIGIIRPETGTMPYSR